MAVAIKQFYAPTLQKTLQICGNYCDLVRFINENQRISRYNFALFRLIVENIALHQGIPTMKPLD